jgi:DNA-binding NtrC family response regulator
VTERASPGTRRVLIVDDEKNILTSLSRLLDLEGFAVETAATARAGLEKLDDGDVDALLLDVRLPDIDGLEVLAQVRTRWPALPVIMMSGHANLDVAVRAIQNGARDFIEKPVGADRLLVSLRNALAFHDLKRSHDALEAERSKTNAIVGSGRAIAELREQIALAAPSKARVLITGENGTGKELVARAVHDGSRRASGPFIKVNCAAIPAELIESELFGHERGAFTGALKAHKGKFEQASGGTLFLDEIGDMRLDVQAKLLRVLQEGEVDRVGGTTPIRVDVRVLAATNKDLTAAIEAGQFREDLYYRINVLPIRVPALRERLEDLPALVEHFMALSCFENDRRAKTIDAEALALLARHDWPGNIRELRNLCERLVILSAADAVTARDISRALPSMRPVKATSGYQRGRPLRDMVDDAERQLIQAALDDFDGQMTKVADALGLERSHLYKKLKSLGLER